MTNVHSILRAGVICAISASLAACSVASTPSSVPIVSAVSSPLATASPAASPTATASAAPASVAPSRKPRPSLDIDPAELAAYLGATITLLDLADGDVAIVVTYVDPTSEESLPFGTYTLASMDQMTSSVPPGTYRLDFHQPPDSTTAQSCTFEIADGEGVVFAAIEGAVAISRTGAAPTEAGELFVATSSSCKA